MGRDVCSDGICYQEISIISLDIMAKNVSNLYLYRKDISNKLNKENNVV